MVRSLGLLIAFLLAAAAIGFGAYTFEHWQLKTRQEKAVDQTAKQVFHSGSSFVAGNKDGDVSVVAFFDYNCPDCRRGAPDLTKLIADDPKVRLVLKELPVLGADSESVARLAIAAKQQGKYFELHEALFREPGRMTRNKALRVARSLGLDRGKLEKDSEDASVTRTLVENKRLARELGVKSVPFYLVGDRVIADSPGDLYGALTAGIADIRQNGCRAAC